MLAAAAFFEGVLLRKQGQYLLAGAERHEGVDPGSQAVLDRHLADLCFRQNATGSSSAALAPVMRAAHHRLYRSPTLDAQE